MQNSFRKVAKLITPPIVPTTIRWCQALSTRGHLFDGHDDIFLDLISKATAYAEYGCGASTIWTANNTSVPILTVDSSKDWLSEVQAKTKRKDNIKYIYVDLGPIGDWGRPMSYQERHKFVDYVEGPWATKQFCDLVLIDGRFRIACFLTTLLRARPGTTILFDDYIGRTYFEVAGSFVSPFRRNKRQTAFIVPEKIDRALIEAERDKFLYVME